MLVEAALVVSIHAFRGEGDLSRCQRRALFQGFNPRLPGGRRHPSLRRPPATSSFQSTPSGGKATVCCVDVHLQRHRFNPRLPGGRRRPCRLFSPQSSNPFQSTPSGGKATHPAIRKKPLQRNDPTSHFPFFLARYIERDFAAARIRYSSCNILTIRSGRTLGKASRQSQLYGDCELATARYEGTSNIDS